MSGIDALKLIEILGSSAAVVIVVFMFLKSLKLRDETLITNSKSRDEKMMVVIERNSSTLSKNSEIAGAMLEALRRLNRS